MEAFELKPGETFEQKIAIENLDYELTDGEYRVRKSIQVGTESITIADKFEIEWMNGNKSFSTIPANSCQKLVLKKFESGFRL